VVTVLIVLLITPFILLQFSGIQNRVADFLTKELSDKLETRIEIGSVNYHFFNQLEIEGFYMEDRQKDTLFYAASMETGFSLSGLLKRKIIVSYLEFNNLYGNFKVDSTGISNADFVFNYFKKTDSISFDLNINKLTLKNSRIEYTKEGYRDLPANIFNPDKMSWREINSEIKIREISKDTVNARVQYFNALEKSGFTLTNVSLKLLGSPKGFYFPEFNIELPESKMNLGKLSVKLNSFSDLQQLSKKAIFSFPLQGAQITLSDFSSFIPEFRNIKDQINLNALITGRISSLRLQNLKLKYGKSFEMDANLDISGLPNLEESFFYGQVNTLQFTTAELQDLISKIDNNPVILPTELNRLGLIGYQGNITGFLSDLVAYGNFSTNLGSISSDISLRFENHLRDLSYNGRLRTSGFQLGQLLNDNAVGRISIDMNTSGVKKTNQSLRGTASARLQELQFNKYSYTNAVFDGNYDGTGFNGIINIKDENIEADFSGIIDFRNPRIPVFDFELDLRNTNLHALNLIREYPDSRLSFRGKTNMNGSTLDNLNGYLHFQDIIFTNQNKTLNTNEIHFTSRTEPDNTRFIIRSDYLNGSFSGNFKYSSIGHTFKRIASQFLPALAENNNTSKPNLVNIDLTMANTAEVSQVLQLPYEFEGITTLKGTIDENRNTLDFQSRSDAIKTSNQIFDNLTMRLETNRQRLQLTGRTQMINKNAELQNVFLSADASRNDLSAKLVWQNNKDETYAGEINTRTTFSKVNQKLQAHTRFNPTQIIISDSIWDIRSSDVYFADSIITVNNFLFENKSQFFRINGVASRSQSDSIVVSMNDLRMEYLTQLIRLSGIQFGGVTTGKLRLYNLLKEPIFLADLNIRDFSMNNDIIGNAKVTTTWDKIKNQLNIKSDFVNNNKDSVATLTGVFVPSKDSIDLAVDAKKLSAAFLNRYFEGIASNFAGLGTGDVRIYGPTKNILITGDVMIREGQATIDMLKTTYRFNDRIILTPNQIILNNITLYDEENNQASANGIISHDGMFDNMNYDVRIRTDNILALNTRSVDEEFFYGRAYLGGTVNIFGNMDEANIVVNGVSRPRTKCYMSMGTASSVMESDFISFIQKNINIINTVETQETRQFANEREFNVKVDMQIEVTPEAEMELIVDPSAGDKITGRGRGNVRILFDTFSDVELFGTVEMETGYYLFTLQTVIRKEFRINEGSTISWTGDPFGAQVNINGYYPLTASLADLIEREELQQITTRSSVPVHCLLYLTEDLMSPTIRFNIDFPASDETLKSRVKNVINTEEMMNRQILYLLLFHKFFTPDEMRAGTNIATGANEVFSFATASLSAQINNWIQTGLNSDILSVGIDWQKTDVASDEWKAQVLIQPNNRLIINGNIGYRNDNLSQSKFIGDFDIEYKLLESGKLRFTAYNHTVDRAQLREARTTQGVGLIYREDFNNLQEMAEYYINLIKKFFSRKEKDPKLTSN
jgi:hypothetical protein